MSETDGFIEEVSEELRRDRLFATFRKYGWIGILIVVILVGGAAYREYAASQQRKAAEALGDSVLTALQSETPADRLNALDAIASDGAASAIVSLLTAATALESDDPARAAELYAQISTMAELPARYTDLAALRRVIVLSESTTPEERMIALTPLAMPGAPYRVLAEEQMALIEIETGDQDAALSRLTTLLNDQEASAGLRRRVSDVIVALGGDPSVSR